MKIVQTPVRFPPYIGGTEKVAFHLSKELIKRGHNVKVICANEPAVGSGQIDGINVERLPFIGKIANSNITLSLYKRLMKEDFDILHTHLPHPWSADISALVTKIRNKPLFLTYHNDTTGKGIDKLIADFYNFTALRFLLKSARRIFITSEGYREKSSFLKPFLDKTVITPLGVNLDQFRSVNLEKDKTEKIIFFLSKLDKFHKYKGLDYLLLSVKKIMKKIPLKLYVGGGGELIDYYKNMVRDCGIEDVVYFLGYLDDEQLLKNYNLCDVFVLPSVSVEQEGFGLAALEAMACKKAVIVSSITGVADDVKKYNAGIVVTPGNTNELSEALCFVLSDTKQRMEMAYNAYGLVNNKYTWDKCVSIVEKEYLRQV